jgi:3-dehydroquinate dehydratase-2
MAGATSDSISKTILILNGPNLNLLGTREPHLYGSDTLASIQTHLTNLYASHALSFFQSNHEGALLDAIHNARGIVDAIIINAGGLTHTSVVLRDALVGVDIPFVEVHVTNVHAREEFRHISLLSEKAVGVICGLGVYGYEAAVEFCVRRVGKKEKK